MYKKYTAPLPSVGCGAVERHLEVAQPTKKTSTFCIPTSSVKIADNWEPLMSEVTVLQTDYIKCSFLIVRVHQFNIFVFLYFSIIVEF